jgi:hypothetical protein
VEVVSRGGIVRAAAVIVRTVAGRAAAATVALVTAAGPALADLIPVVPPEKRGRIDAERSGSHDSANIRTIFWNYGMVGDYPPNPLSVDLTVFHSAEAPYGSGMNYSDGVTPFVLARVTLGNGSTGYIMETGFRERQGISPTTNRMMRFEPRPGFFEPHPNDNIAGSPAISTDERTWPESWPDKENDPTDPGWKGSWNGYFGKRPAAEQESFTVMDDQAYDAFNYYPDTRDSTRRGLGLRVEVRGFQWANPQAGNVIFWHYDITNESTTDYDDNVIFGLYMDSGVGGSAVSCDGNAESDDDNAFFDKSLGLNLVYTWDKSGHGVDLSGPCGTTGYLGYAYLETPGNATDLGDNDSDGITDEQRDGGPGVRIVGPEAIRAEAAARYDLAAFERFYGPIDNRPAFRFGEWWTGDEDMDWKPDVHDLGADGVPETEDIGEGDGMPSAGEPNFDRTDLNESDQIGLTGFKMNRIRAGQGNPDQTADDIVFFTDRNEWPERLWTKFTDPNPAARFDSALAANYNIGFLFASGPFVLKAGQTERFSLALAFGADLFELRTNVRTVQQIYDANYQFAVPPPLPTLSAEAGDGFVRLSWDDVAERGVDPVSNEFDFEGYRIYRSTDPEFRDPRVVTNPRGTPFPSNGKPEVQYDIVDGRRGYSERVVDGVAYFLGEDTGLRHTWTDTTVTNGQRYYYAVTAYDYGSLESVPDSLAYYPSENAIAITGKPRGGFLLPKNVVEVRPNPRVPGFVAAAADSTVHVSGRGVGEVIVQAVNSNLVPDGHLYRIDFSAPAVDSVRATGYALTDSTTGEILFRSGQDLEGAGTGPIADGLLPVIRTQQHVQVDSARTVFDPGSPTNAALEALYQPARSINLRRPGFPDDITIAFSDVVVDTGLAIFPIPARPAKFTAVAHTETGDLPLDFRFRDLDGDGTLSRNDESIDLLTYTGGMPTASDITWRVQIDSLTDGGPLRPPAAGDTWRLRLTRPFGPGETFVFTTRGARVDLASAVEGFSADPYVVPNPYVGAASFEPQRFADTGRGERRLEFRGIPQGSTIRIYTVRGDLVQTLQQDGTAAGFVEWNLRTKDNLDAAPGLYIFHVDAPDVGTRVGKFAVIK